MTSTAIADPTPEPSAFRAETRAWLEANCPAGMRQPMTSEDDEGVQMHGGMGMTDAFEIGFFMKRARVLQELWGETNFHLDAQAQRRGH
jgi:hypothetical protein